MGIRKNVKEEIARIREEERLKQLARDLGEETPEFVLLPAKIPNEAIYDFIFSQTDRLTNLYRS